MARLSKRFRRFLPQFLRNRDERKVAQREDQAFPSWEQMKDIDPNNPDLGPQPED